MTVAPQPPLSYTAESFLSRILRKHICASKVSGVEKFTSLFEDVLNSLAQHLMRSSPLQFAVLLHDLKDVLIFMFSQKYNGNYEDNEDLWLRIAACFRRFFVDNNFENVDFINSLELFFSPQMVENMTWESLDCEERLNENSRISDKQSVFSALCLLDSLLFLPERVSKNIILQLGRDLCGRRLLGAKNGLIDEKIVFICSVLNPKLKSWLDKLDKNSGEQTFHNQEKIESILLFFDKFSVLSLLGTDCGSLDGPLLSSIEFLSSGKKTFRSVDSLKYAQVRLCICGRTIEGYLTQTQVFFLLPLLEKEELGTTEERKDIEILGSEHPEKMKHLEALCAWGFLKKSRTRKKLRKFELSCENAFLPSEGYLKKWIFENVIKNFKTRNEGLSSENIGNTNERNIILDAAIIRILKFNFLISWDYFLQKLRKYGEENWGKISLNPQESAESSPISSPFLDFSVLSPEEVKGRVEALEGRDLLELLRGAAGEIRKIKYLP